QVVRDRLRLQCGLHDLLGEPPVVEHRRRRHEAVPVHGARHPHDRLRRAGQRAGGGGLLQVRHHRHVRQGCAGHEARGRREVGGGGAQEGLRVVVVRSLALAAIRFSALLFAAALLVAACSATSPVGDAPPPPVLWTYESVSWYNRYSLNSTVGPLVTGRTVIYGGTYSYQNTKASRLAALDPVSGRPPWRMEHAGAFGPLVIQSGIIVVASEDSVLGLDVTSGTQRWDVPLRARTLTAAGPVVLVAERQTIHALDPASGRLRWQVKSGTDPALAGDTVLFLEGRTLHAAAGGHGRGPLDARAPLRACLSTIGGRRSPLSPRRHRAGVRELERPSPRLGYPAAQRAHHGDRPSRRYALLHHPDAGGLVCVPRLRSGDAAGS